MTLLGGPFHGHNSSSTEVTYADIIAQVKVTTARAERAYYALRTRNGSSGAAARMFVSEGIYHPSATGFDKGDNTINYDSVYDDSTLLTCMALAKEFRESKTVSLDKWDALVPDQEVPETVEEAAVMETVEVDDVELTDTEFGVTAHPQKGSTPSGRLSSGF